MNTATQIEIKSNNFTGDDNRCAECGKWDSARIGPEIFLKDTWQIVCEECAEKLEPGIIARFRVLENSFWLERYGRTKDECDKIVSLVEPPY